MVGPDIRQDQIDIIGCRIEIHLFHQRIVFFKEVDRNKAADGTPEKYGVEGYPTKIIIDPQGNINKIVVGEDEAFYQYLDQLFK